MTSFQSFKPCVVCARVYRVCRVLALGTGFRKRNFDRLAVCFYYTHPTHGATHGHTQQARSPPSINQTAQSFIVQTIN